MGTALPFLAHRKRLVRGRKLGRLCGYMTPWGNRPLLIAGIHFLLSMAVGFLAFAAAWGSGLSDANHGDGGAMVFGILLAILQAPVALIQWLAMHASANGKTGIELPWILPLTALSSVFYGHILAFLIRRLSSRPNL
jgi:hypothetical protein